MSLLLLSLSLAACGGGEDPPQTTGHNVGSVAVDFALPDLGGTEVSLSQYRGDVVLINFWATWCPPCRAEIPEIEAAATWEETVARLAEFDRALIAATSGETRTLKEALGIDDKAPSSIAVLVGPEGGFSDEEVQQVCESGAVPVSLGPRILRTETAAMVVPALILHERGEMEL